MDLDVLKVFAKRYVQETADPMYEKELIDFVENANGDEILSMLATGHTKFVNNPVVLEKTENTVRNIISEVGDIYARFYKQALKKVGGQNIGAARQVADMMYKKHIAKKGAKAGAMIGGALAGTAAAGYAVGKAIGKKKKDKDKK